MRKQNIKSVCSKCGGTGEIIKKKINGKNKGNRGELLVCKILTEKIGIGKFNRVPNSGSFGTSHSLSEEAQLCLSGDLIAPTPDFIFSIENKCGYDIDISKILSINPQIKQIESFLEQSCIDADRTNRIPMVIYSKDYRDPIVIIPLSGHSRESEISSICDKVNSYIIFKHEPKDFSQWNRWVIFVLNEFLEKTDSNFFLKDKKNDTKK